MNKITHPWTLTTTAVADAWRWKRPLTPIVLAVALPVAVISALTGDTDPTLSAYSAFATLFMNVALLWAVVRLATRKPVGVKLAYYEGTAMTVRFLLLSGLYFLMTVPFLFGALIYINGTFGTASVVTTMEKVLLGAVWLLLAWPTLYWLTRTIFGVFTVQTGLGPVAAVRSSRGLVRGRSGRVFGRLLWLVVAVITLVTLPAFVVLSTLEGTAAQVVLAGVQLLAALIVLPVSYAYLYRLYKDLQPGTEV